MARAVWTGSISFGLVNIPVELHSATEDHTIHFHQLERDTGDRIRNRRVNERTQREVGFADIVKGRDLGGGEYVVVEQEELDAVAPGRSRSIDINAFVDLSEIDPVYFQRTYWLVPKGDQHKPYKLLVGALEQLKRAGVAPFVMRGKQYLGAVRADQGALALTTLHFADEVRRPPGELDEPARQGKEMDMALSLVEAMTGPWRPEDYHDTYRERVERLVEDKRAGRETVTESGPPEATSVSDLLDALTRSVREHSDGDGRQRGQRQSGLDSASKSQLSELARDLEIPGRSKMNRNQLRNAVENASSDTARARDAAS